jgi:ParB-like chromosome segregation protein Spo0J
MNDEKVPKLYWLKPSNIRIPDHRLNIKISDMKSFEESIKAERVLQPVYVFQDDEGIYWLADGRNRLEIAKKYGYLVQAYVLHGTKEDAMLYSAKLNIHRGKVNYGELAEFVGYLKSLGWTLEKIANELHYKSKGYISFLLQVAENRTVLEKLKRGLISLKEAKNEVLGSLREQEPREAICESKAESPKVEEKQQKEERKLEAVKEQQEVGLSNEDIGLTSNLNEAMRGKGLFQPLGPEEREKKDLRGWNCAYCGAPFTKLDSESGNVRWIPVHKHEKSLALDILEKARAEREAQNESPQP